MGCQASILDMELANEIKIVVNRPSSFDEWVVSYFGINKFHLYGVYTYNNQTVILKKIDKVTNRITLITDNNKEYLISIDDINVYLKSYKYKGPLAETYGVIRQVGQICEYIEHTKFSKKRHSARIIEVREHSFMLKYATYVENKDNKDSIPRQMQKIIWLPIKTNKITPLNTIIKPTGYLMAAVPPM